MAFTGERDLEGIQNFLKENVSHKWVEGHAETDLWFFWWWQIM